MSLRHYLRGLGIGILVTAVFMGVTQKPTTMTDAQIKQRAAQLGMVEEGVLADLSEEEVTESLAEETEETDTGVQERIPADEIDQEAMADDVPNQVNGSTEEEASRVLSEAFSEASFADEGSAETSEVIITIENGNGSDTASRKLYEAGIVDSVTEFDRFLVKNGYDRKLRMGVYRIPTDSSWDEIARIICRMQ